MPYIENKCKGCFYFDRYYVIDAGKLSKLDYGMCKQRWDKVQDSCGTCHKWRSARKKRAGDRNFGITILEMMHKDLDVIKEMLSGVEEGSESRAEN